VGQRPGAADRGRRHHGDGLNAAVVVMGDRVGLLISTANVEWAIQDSNLGPLPYQRGRHSDQEVLVTRAFRLRFHRDL
jgi:hypothetical protein